MAENSSASREQRYRGVRDRETLEILPGGLEIVRSIKHEPISLARTSKRKLLAKTDKHAGSKFLPQWTLWRYVHWTAAQVAQLGWTRETGIASYDVLMDEVIGVSHGQYVRTIRIVSDGRYVHAYPVREHE